MSGVWTGLLGFLSLLNNISISLRKSKDISTKTIVILEWCGYVQVLWHRKTRSTSEKLLVEPWNNSICSSARKIACSTQWRSGFARRNGADWRLSIQSYLCVHWWKDWPKDQGLGIYSCFSIMNLGNGALCTVPLSHVRFAVWIVDSLSKCLASSGLSAFVWFLNGSCCKLQHLK